MWLYFSQYSDVHVSTPVGVTSESQWLKKSAYMHKKSQFIFFTKKVQKANRGKNIN